MKEIVLITGASGAIAKVLSKKIEKDYTVRFLTRKKKTENEFEWDLNNNTIDEQAFENVSHIIHLAGANISERRWTEERKKELIDSRVNSAKLILNTLKNKNIKLKSFISASGINFYGIKTTDKIFSENDPAGNDFLSKVVQVWEKAADEFTEQDVAERVVKIRTAVVLSKNDGALAKMITPIKFGIGSPIGSGKQYMPWIHIDDICAIYKFALKNPEIRGSYNASAPQHTTNENLTRIAAKILKKPLFMPNVPPFVLKLMFGELADILLQGSRASSEKIIKAGFDFKFPVLEGALEDLLKK